MPNNYFLILSLLLFFSCRESEQPNKNDIQSVVIAKDFKTVDVDSSFQISFPRSFSKSNILFEEAILQYNDLYNDQHFILIKSEKTRLTLLEEFRQIRSFSKILNQRSDVDVVRNDTVENLSCHIYYSNSREQYSYWLTRYKCALNNYILCRWTTKKNESEFIDDAKLIGESFLKLESNF